ncbi:glycerate kinase, partial [Escherichia coli]|nr:glycerate kinase [Escherichia coli]
MKVVIAPDSFKESLTAKQVSEAIKTGLVRVWHDAEFVTVPVADGGEGTVQSLIDATQGEQVFTTVTAPLGNDVE